MKEMAESSRMLYKERCSESAMVDNNVNCFDSMLRQK